MRSGLSVGSAYGGAMSSSSSLVVSAAPASTAASRFERLRRHRENIRKCARELGVDLQGSRSGNNADQQLAVVGSATGVHSGTRRGTSRAHAPPEEPLEQSAMDQSAGTSVSSRGGSTRTSTEVARTRLRPVSTSDISSEVPSLSATRRSAASDMRATGPSEGEMLRHRLDPPSMMDDIFEVHGVLMQQADPGALKDALRPASSSSGHENGEAADSSIGRELGLLPELGLPVPDTVVPSADLDVSSASRRTCSQSGEVQSPHAAHLLSTWRSGEEVVLAAKTPPDPKVGLPVAVDVLTDPEQSLGASPAGGSHWADTSASLSEVRSQDEQMAEFATSGSESALGVSRSAFSPKAAAPEATPTDFSFGGILERWRQQYSDFQHAVSNASSSPAGFAGRAKSPAGGNADLIRSKPATTGGLAEDDPEVVLQRIKRDLGLEGSPLAKDLETAGNGDYGLILSETSSAHTDSIFERIQNDMSEFDHLTGIAFPMVAESPGLPVPENDSSLGDDACGEQLSKFHLGLLDGFESFAKDGLDRFAEHLHAGATVASEDDKSKDMDPSGSPEVVLARLQALEAELAELRNKQADLAAGDANRESPPSSPRRPSKAQPVLGDEAAKQMQSSLATLLSSTASSIFGPRVDVPSTPSAAEGLAQVVGASKTQVDMAEPSFASLTSQTAVEATAPKEDKSRPAESPTPLELSTSLTADDLGDGRGDGLAEPAAASPSSSRPTDLKSSWQTEETIQPIAVASSPSSALDAKAASVDIVKEPQVVEERVSAPPAIDRSAVDLIGEKAMRSSDVAVGVEPERSFCLAASKNPPATPRGADVAVGVTEMQASPQFGGGVSMMDKLFADSVTARGATQTSSTQTSPLREPLEPKSISKRALIPPHAAPDTTRAWDGSGDAYFPADRWRLGAASSDCFAPGSYRPLAAPHEFAPALQHPGILAGGLGGSRPGRRYPPPHVAPPTAPLSPSAGHSAGWHYGQSMPELPAQRSSTAEQRMFPPTGLPGYPDRKQLPPAFAEGVHIGSREDDQLLLRTYEVYRQQQLDLMRPA